MTDRPCPDCPYRDRGSRVEGAVIGFVFGVGALTIILSLAMAFRWLFTYVL